MTAAQVFDCLEREGIALFFDGDRLRFRGPKERYTPELRELVRSHESSIRSALAPTSWNVSLQAVFVVRWDDLVSAGLSENDARARAVAEISSAANTPAPALTLRDRLGIDHETFITICRQVIHRPGPSTAVEDATVCLELLRRHGGRR